MSGLNKVLSLVFVLLLVVAAGLLAILFLTSPASIDLPLLNSRVEATERIYSLPDPELRPTKAGELEFGIWWDPADKLVISGVIKKNFEKGDDFLSLVVPREGKRDLQVTANH